MNSQKLKNEKIGNTVTPPKTQSETVQAVRLLAVSAQLSTVRASRNWRAGQGTAQQQLRCEISVRRAIDLYEKVIYRTSSVGKWLATR